MNRTTFGCDGGLKQKEVVATGVVSRKRRRGRASWRHQRWRASVRSASCARNGSPSQRYCAVAKTFVSRRMRGSVRSFVYLVAPSGPCQCNARSSRARRRSGYTEEHLPDPAASCRHCGAIPASDFSTIRLSENCTKFIVRNGLALELRICGSLLMSSDWWRPCSPPAANARSYLPPTCAGVDPQNPRGRSVPTQASINPRAPGADNGCARRG